MDKSTFRILARVGMILVIFGFFMPISCNMNGFQIARTLETFGGSNIHSIALYAVFIFSCIGVIIPILYFFQRKTYDIKYDWIVWVIVTFTFSFFILSLNDANTSFVRFRLQSGAYLIIIGIIISLISLIKATIYDKDIVENKNVFNGMQQDYIANTDDTFKEDKNYCTQCGMKLGKGNIFCTECGEKI